MSEKPRYDWQDSDEVDEDQQDEYLSFAERDRWEELEDEAEESESDLGDDEY